MDGLIEEERGMEGWRNGGFLAGDGGGIRWSDRRRKGCLLGRRHPLGRQRCGFEAKRAVKGGAVDEAFGALWAETISDR